jgi:hypothetical protein
MRIPTLPLRGTLWFASAALVLLALVDGGSVMLTRLAVPEDAKTAGQVAAEATEGMPANRQTALAALGAAQDQARTEGITVADEDFTVYPDGRVKLTATRTAPTLLLHRIERLRSYTEVSTTVTVKALPYS